MIKKQSSTVIGGSSISQKDVTDVKMFADQAELAATAANISGKVYATPADGVDPVTGVADGAYFNVRSSNDESYIDEYQNVGGSAVATGKSYPSGSYVETIAEYIALPFKQGKSYALHERVQLANGDVVKSTVAGNTVNPNVDMTGWVYANDAETAKHAVYVPNGGGSIGAIGGTFRGYSGGVQLISDTAHAPIGTTGISKADTYTVRIDHAFGAAKVGVMNLTADESLAAMGVISGASVAQNYSLAKVFAPLYFTCKGDGTITKVSPLFEGSVVLDAASNPANGILRFTHPLKSVAAHQAIACNRGFVDNISKPMEINVFNNDGGTYTQISAYTEQVDSVWIKYNETTAKFEAAQGINKALYSFVFNASTGLLSITHNTVKTGSYLTQPDIIPFQTANRYAINGVNANTTAILCYDPAGNIVKTPTTADFSFFFKIKPAVREMILTAIPATNEFEVFVGNCFVPVDNLQKVPSGNIWFYGAMNK